MNFDKIATSAPVNRTAAMQTASGDAWVPTINILDWYPDQPKLANIDRAARLNPEFKDFTGMKFGFLTVLGLMDKKSDNTPASWVCRCVCGSFCTRRAKSIKNGIARGNTFIDRCGMCQYQARLRTGWAPAIKETSK